MADYQPDLWDAAADRRDLGIQRSADRNERSNEGWQDEAILHLQNFLLLCGGRTFLAEEIRAYATARGLCGPTDGRAWGAVLQRAKREGLITAVGYAPAASSNLSPKVLWRKASTEEG